MSTSGVTGFNLTTTQIIRESFDLCGIAVEGEDLTNEEYDRALRSLNLMLRRWQSEGIHLWTYQEATLFVETDRSAYPLNNSVSVRAVDSDKYVITGLSGDVLMGATDFMLDKNTLVTDQGDDFILATGDPVGFLLADNTVFWTTYVSPNMIADPFPEDLSSGTLIFWYPVSGVLQPVERVLDVRRLDATTQLTQNEVPVQFEAHKDFFSLPNRKSRGTINEATFQRSLPHGVLHVWQVPDRETQLISFTYERKIQNFVNSDDDPDIPDHYINAVVTNLALYIAGKFNVSQERKIEIRVDADAELEQAKAFDDANYDFKVSLNRNSRS